jgi:hypothetical protein
VRATLPTDLARTAEGGPKGVPLRLGTHSPRLSAESNSEDQRRRLALFYFIAHSPTEKVVHMSAMIRPRLSLGRRVELPAKIAERDRCRRAPLRPRLHLGPRFVSRDLNEAPP